MNSTLSHLPVAAGRARLDDSARSLEPHDRLRLAHLDHPGLEQHGRRADRVRPGHGRVLGRLHDDEAGVAVVARRRHDEVRVARDAPARLAQEHAAQPVAVAPERLHLLEDRRPGRRQDAADDRRSRSRRRRGSRPRSTSVRPASGGDDTELRDSRRDRAGCVPRRVGDRDRDARARHGAHDPELAAGRPARGDLHGARRLVRAGDLDARLGRRDRCAARGLRARVPRGQDRGRRVPDLARAPGARRGGPRPAEGGRGASIEAARAAQSSSARASSATSATRRWPPSSRACSRSSRTRSRRCSPSASCSAC